MARPRKEVEVNIQHTHDDVKIPVTGDLNRDDLHVQEVEVYANVKDLDEKAKALAFMEEPVTIHLHDSSDPNAEKFAFVSVNGEGPLAGGKGKWLARGMSHTIKRKFLDVLIRARTTSFTQPFKDETNEQRVNFLRPHSAMRFPFSVERDDNPQGHKWLRELMGR